MCRSWSAESFTLLAAAVCASSFLGEQPAKDATAMIATVAIMSVRGDLFVMFSPGEFRAIPPSAAKRLEQRRRIGKAAGLRLQTRDPRLLVSLFRVQQGEIVGV